MQSQEDSKHTHRVLCATEAALYAARKAATAAEAEYGPIADWDTSLVDDLSELFEDPDEEVEGAARELGESGGGASGESAARERRESDDGAARER